MATTDCNFEIEKACRHLRWVNSRQSPGFECLRAFKNQLKGRVPVESFFYLNNEPWLMRVRTFLKECQAERWHVYYSVSSFDREEAKAGFALPGRLAHVDADNVGLPPKGPAPTVIVQTSPGNYQFLYELDRPVKRDELEPINAYLTNLVGGDRGGHSAAKLLRLPGTRNFKPDRPNSPLVKILSKS